MAAPQPSRSLNSLPIVRVLTTRADPMAVGVVVAAVIVVVVVIIQTVRARRCGTGSDSIGCTAPTVARISRLSDGPVDQRLGAPDSRADLQSGDPLLDAKAEFLLPPDSPDRRGNHRRAYHEILRPREIRHLHHGGQMRHQEPDWQPPGWLPRSRADRNELSWASS